jgi:hypothetical protein
MSIMPMSIMPVGLLLLLLLPQLGVLVLHGGQLKEGRKGRAEEVMR